MNWSRATDGNLWSLARTNGTNNPKLQASVTDASGITLALTGGALALTSGGALSATSTGNMSLTSSGTLALSGTSYSLAAGDTTARGVAICKYKTSQTSRSNNTLSADPDLSYAVPGSGAYAIRLFLLLSGGAGGIQSSVEYTGTSSTAQWAEYGILQGVTSTSILTAFSTTRGTNALNASGDWLVLEATLISTGAGILALFWGQNSTNAAATIVQAGSYMTVTQLS